MWSQNLRRFLRGAGSPSITKFSQPENLTKRLRKHNYKV